MLWNSSTEELLQKIYLYCPRNLSKAKVLRIEDVYGIEDVEENLVEHYINGPEANSCSSVLKGNFNK